MIISEKGEETQKASFSRAEPFKGKIAAKFLLSGDGSSRKTYHIELDIAGSGITYRPGDSVGIIPENDHDVVCEIIDLLKANRETPVKDKRQEDVEMCLYDYLKTKANLSRISTSLLKKLSAAASDQRIQEKLLALADKNNKEALATFSLEHDIVDVLRLCPFTISAEDFCSELSPLLPRFYSISSSQKKHENEIHLTVALASFMKGGKERYGVATHFLCSLAEVSLTPVQLYIQKAHSFFLPEDLSTDIIMIGPGTGVAPFRSFLQERIAMEATGNHWLFFGERNRASDFYYEEYFLELANAGKLRLDLAFSRDAGEKVYVQHKMLENSAELWRWIQKGAVIYICGDAEKMAKDVEKALLTIAQKEGAMSEELSKEYIKAMRAEKKLLLDVY